MLEVHGLNYWALLVAWVINMGVGAFWYSPAGFGKMWSKLTGVNMMKMPKDEANNALTAMALAAVVYVFALGITVLSLRATTVVEGLKVGVLLWAGFTAATTVGNSLYQRLGWKFWWLNSSYFLVVMVAGAIVLATWR